MQDTLNTAIAMHRTGQLGTAATLYQRVLASEPGNTEALHLLGVLHHQQGDHARAVELIGRAVSLRPNAYIFHANLAEAYRALGDHERAVGCCRAALQIWPDYPEALCNLGAALQGLGKSAEAVEPLRRALALRPHFVVAHNNQGIALRELGRQDEAMEHFRQAVGLDPAFAPAQTNLGQILLDRGKAEEALPPCEEAVRLQPNLASLHHNLANVYRTLKRPVDAQGSYLEALRLDPDLAISNAHLGLVLQGEARFADALPWLKKAVGLEPENATFWQWLAELHDEMEEPSESIPCWERSLALSPDRGDARIALGWALQEEGRLAEARECYLIAARLQPESAVPHFNLGGLFEEMGNLAEAEASFRMSIRLQPGYALPHGRLATLLRGKLPDEDLAALEGRLADEQLGKTPRARLSFALGHALDARGDHVRAAESVKVANALTRELGKGRRDYSTVDHDRFVDGMIRAFDRETFARLAGSGPDTRRPVFVFGLPRSGTTLTEQVLASHSRIHGAGELRLARRTYESIPATLGRAEPTRDIIPHLDPEALRRLAAVHLDRLAILDGGRADRVVDKMPDNYLYVGMLSVVFPNAVFIHCRRDLRDVAVSCWMTDFRSIRWANDPDQIAHRFRNYRRLMDHWREVLPVEVHEVDYEETVTDLESVARRMVAACGLDWEPACLDFHQTQRPVRTASVTQVRQPVYQRSVARWKNYESDLAGLFAALPSEPDPSPSRGRLAEALAL